MLQAFLNTDHIIFFSAKTHEEIVLWDVNPAHDDL